MGFGWGFFVWLGLFCFLKKVFLVFPLCAEEETRAARGWRSTARSYIILQSCTKPSQSWEERRNFTKLQWIFPTVELWMQSITQQQLLILQEIRVFPCFMPDFADKMSRKKWSRWFQVSGPQRARQWNGKAPGVKRWTEGCAKNKAAKSLLLQTGLVSRKITQGNKLSSQQVPSSRP